MSTPNPVSKSIPLKIPRQHWVSAVLFESIFDARLTV
jgi:hypothetical protein